MGRRKDGDSLYYYVLLFVFMNFFKYLQVQRIQNQLTHFLISGEVSTLFRKCWRWKGCKNMVLGEYVFVLPGTKGYICLATDQLKMDLLFGRKILCYVYLS